MLRFSEDDRMLVVLPHLDDELHCAGFVFDAIRNGVDVLAIGLSSCEESLPPGYSRSDICGEFNDSCNVLGIEESVICEMKVRNFPSQRQEILDVIRNNVNYFKPTFVLCPSSTDRHQDHEVVHEEVVRFCKRQVVLGYIHTPNMRKIKPNVLTPITEDAMKAKVSCWDCYKSQHEKHSVIDSDWISASCNFWGGLAGSRYAEAYEWIGGCIG
jgi:LmbE family N-acetylglucosaminyl deacetylase